ncbi:hypothetical protein RUND412_011299 [Rhizina undulata]
MNFIPLLFLSYYPSAAGPRYIPDRAIPARAFLARGYTESSSLAFLLENLKNRYGERSKDIDNLNASVNEKIDDLKDRLENESTRFNRLNRWIMVIFAAAVAVKGGIKYSALAAYLLVIRQGA